MPKKQKNLSWHEGLAKARRGIAGPAKVKRSATARAEDKPRYEKPKPKPLKPKQPKRSGLDITTVEIGDVLSYKGKPVTVTNVRRDWYMLEIAYVETVTCKGLSIGGGSPASSPIRNFFPGCGGKTREVALHFRSLVRPAVLFPL